MALSDLKRLVELQDIDCRIRDMKRELEDIPAREKEEEDRLEEHRELLADAETRLKTDQAAIKQLEGEVQDCREKIQKLRQQQMTLKTNEQFKAMDHEIGGIQQQISQLEERQLVLMDQVDASQSGVDKRRADLTEEARCVKEDVERIRQRVPGLEKGIAELEGQRQGVEQGIAGEYMETYNRMMHRRDRVLVPLVEGVCGGCHMNLPPSVRQNVMRGERLVACDHCGRMLYVG